MRLPSSLTSAICLQCVSICLPVVDAARILFFNFPTFSHLRSPLIVANELASRGHVVWTTLPLKFANSMGLNSKGVKILYYKALETFDIETEIVEKTMEGFWANGNVPILFQEHQQICDLILKDTELFENIKNLDLDLMVLDATPLIRMLTIIAYKLNKPFIFLGPTVEPHFARVPFVPATDPCQILMTGPVMDLKTRILNFLLSVLGYMYDPFAPYGAVGIYAPEKPYISLEALTAKASLWLITQEPLLDYPKATMPNVKFVGAPAGYDNPPLPDDFRRFMDKAKEGAVIVSFGSIANKFPDETVRRLFEAFARTKYHYVFKIDHNFGSIADNVIAVSWIPQASLLAHPNAKLFITHCGANGQTEAFLNGVPMIGFPMFAEQSYNSMRLVHHGFGLKMDFHHFTVEELAANINEVIENKTYSQRIKHVAKIARERNASPKDKAVYWIEHVIKYGDRHLRSYGQDMSLYQYLSLDVIGVLIFLFYVISFSAHMLICFCISKCRQVKLHSKTKSD